MAPLLEIEDLHTHISLREGTVRAVDGVSLYVDPGETLGIVGESGSGKTMTALSIMGLLPVGGHIADGSIHLGGRRISGLSDEHMRKIRGDEIGMIFQDPLTSLNPTMTVGKQIAEVVLLHREASKEQAMERAAEVLGLVGLPRPEERLNEYPHQFSGGMRQRVMIAMALACEPKLLIADEAHHRAGRDDPEADPGADRRPAQAAGDVGDPGHPRPRRDRRRADRVAVMYAGKIAETTATSTLFANPRHPYTEALFHALPDKAAETGERLYSIPGAPPDLIHPPQGCRFAPRCRYAKEHCREEEPRLLGETPGHTYACFYPVGETERGAKRATAPVAAATRAEAPAEQFAKVPGEVVLATKDLVKDFPVTAGILQRRVGSVSAVAGVSFDIRRGETFGLVGESGCGKTTIGRVIVGLEKATAGTISFGGVDLATVSGREYRRLRRKIQYMFQDSYASLDPRMRAARSCASRWPCSTWDPARNRSGASRRCLTMSACPDRQRTATRMSSPAASASAWGSPGR